MRKIQEGSISKRLTWMNMLVSAVVLLLACSAFTAYDWVTWRASMVRVLSIRAQMIGANSASALLFDDPQSAENTLVALRADPDIVSAAIYTSQGSQFATYVRDAGKYNSEVPRIPAGQVVTHVFQDGQVVLVQSIVFRGSTTGTVVIRSDLTEIYDRLERYVGIAMVVLLTALIAAFAISRMAQRAISEPIIDLAEIARAVSRDRNYSVRAAPNGHRGELTILVEAFNEMLVQIQARDITLQEARNELEQRVQERTTQLAAANRELEAFSYSVSHDLRAPLRSIDGFSQALLEDCAHKLDVGERDYLQRVRSATQRMSLLIDDLLNLSRVTRSEMRSEEVDLSALAMVITERLQEEDPGRKVQSLIAKGLVAKGDSQLLRVVIDNLLRNAWKYTSRHDGAKIEFGVRQGDGQPIYFVRDDGAGFDPSYADRLFAPFQRLHAATEFPGTGIGLATVQRIVNRHGGKVWAEGGVERGATFYFTL